MEVGFKMKMSTALHERIREAAFKQKRSMADCVREAIEQWLKKQKPRRR